MMDLNTGIPCKVKVGNGTIGRGVPFGVLLTAIERFNVYYYEILAENEKLKQRIADMEGAGEKGKFVDSTANIRAAYIPSTFVPTQKQVMDLVRDFSGLVVIKHMQDKNTALRGQVEALTAEAKDLKEQLDYWAISRELDKRLRKPAVSVGQFLYECDPASGKLLVWRVESLRYMERAGLPPMDFWTVGLKRVQMDGTLGKLFCFMAADIGVTLFKTPEEAFIKAGVRMAGARSNE